MHARRFAILVALALAGAATTSTAHADIITGTLTYTDGDGDLNPIRRAKVEIQQMWAGDNSFIWHTDFISETNDQGVFVEDVPFRAAGDRYRLRVFATNPGVQVFQINGYTIPFWREPGLPAAEMVSTAVFSGQTHTFNFNFNDLWARQPFNIADAALRGFDYANIHRDPTETDTLTRVDVLLNDPGNTYYDPIVHAIRMDPALALDDLTVLHEYAHWLQERISSFHGIAAFHDGCIADAAGRDHRSQGYAWMEGFASYFPHAVLRFAGNVDTVPGNPFTASIMESPFCPTPAPPLLPVPPIALERFVASALFDLIDEPTDPGSSLFFEPSDVFCRARETISNDHLIFQIFDRELDFDDGLRNPTLQEFTDAWAARGLDLPLLRSSFLQHGVVPITPAPVVRYDSDLTRTNVAIWRPGMNASFWIFGSTAPPVVLGTSGDLPVPADYDGDGFTDLAVFRNGTWIIKLSGSGVDQTLSWGTFGDRPLPGDYDNDGEADLAVYRPSNGHVYIHDDTCGAGAAHYLGYGTPIVGDFDGDGFDDPGVAALGAFTAVTRFGLPFAYTFSGNGIPVIGHFDQNGQSDVALFRSNGVWDIKLTGSNSFGSSYSIQWGITGDVPVPGDYDGNGRTDLAIWRPSSGEWWIRESDGPQWAVIWGVASDTPVPAF